MSRWGFVPEPRLLALMIGSTAAAQDTQPPPDAAQNPATAAAEPSHGRRNRRHRLAHPPRSAEPGLADRLRRPGRHRQDRPQLDQRRAAAPAELGRRPQRQVQQFAATSATRPTAAVSAPAAAEIDLRYLGSRRVLVLVDGLRYVNGASASGVPGSTDLNSIPDSAIERIEVLQDGASAIYGSDAIAGVVNIITKKRQKGFDASAQLGGYQRRRRLHSELLSSAGAMATRVRCEVVVGGNYVKQGAVSSGDRAISRFPGSLFDDLRRWRLFRLPADGPLHRSADPALPAISLRPAACRTTVPDLTLNGPVFGGPPVYDPLNPTCRDRLP